MGSAKVVIEEPVNHPSYGCITIGKVSTSKGMSLFGSSIKHNNLVRLSIFHASLRRSHHTDRHRTDKNIIEVYMSPVQFSQMIMSAGEGVGVPCTINRLNDESVPEPDFQSKREQFVNEFREKTDNLASKFDDLIKEVSELVDKPTVGKKERQNLLSKLGLLKQAVESDLPFVATQFNEQMDKTVNEAKGEVEAFVSNLVETKGLEALKNNILSLE